MAGQSWNSVLSTPWPVVLPTYPPEGGPDEAGSIQLAVWCLLGYGGLGRVSLWIQEEDSCFCSLTWPAGLRTGLGPVHPGWNEAAGGVGEPGGPWLWDGAPGLSFVSWAHALPQTQIQASSQHNPFPINIARVRNPLIQTLHQASSFVSPSRVYCVPVVFKVWC